MTAMRDCPDWPLLDDELMSNFDHEVDEAVAQRLRTEQVCAKYPGWNFNADCWFADGQFHAAVYCYQVHRATMSAETPEELMVIVSDAFGQD